MSRYCTGISIWRDILWKKEKWKQPFPQLKIPACRGRYDLSIFPGTQVTQLYMITAAGKWGLYQGSDRNKYVSYHIADLLHGYGAQLVFDGIWRGPEYGPEVITMEKVFFISSGISSCGSMCLKAWHVPLKNCRLVLCQRHWQLFRGL